MGGGGIFIQLMISKYKHSLFMPIPCSKSPPLDKEISYLARWVTPPSHMNSESSWPTHPYERVTHTRVIFLSSALEHSQATHMTRVGLLVIVLLKTELRCPQIMKILSHVMSSFKLNYVIEYVITQLVRCMDGKPPHEIKHS